MPFNKKHRKRRQRYERDRELQRQEYEADLVLAIKHGVKKYPVYDSYFRATVSKEVPLLPPILRKELGGRVMEIMAKKKG